MISASVSIDRSSLSLAALTISGDGSGTYSLTRDGLGRPAITARSTYAEDSSDVAGSLLTQAVKEMSSLPLEVLVQAATSADLDAAISALDAALWQFSYQVTVTVDGVAKVYNCGPAAWAPSSGKVDHGLAAQFVDVLTVTIPVQPLGA